MFGMFDKSVDRFCLLQKRWEERLGQIFQKKKKKLLLEFKLHSCFGSINSFLLPFSCNIINNENHFNLVKFSFNRNAKEKKSPTK